MTEAKWKGVTVVEAARLYGASRQFIHAQADKGNLRSRYERTRGANGKLTRLRVRVVSLVDLKALAKSNRRKLLSR